MRKVMLVAVVAGLMTGIAGAASGGTPYQAEATCPVDNVKFKYTATMSSSTWGSELDGKPIGSWEFPMPIPQCPDSRFPVYQDEFSAEQTSAIRALVATPEYAAVKDEASYYLLHFVLQRLDHLEPMNAAWLLMQATWQVRGDDARYARYAAEAVPAMDAALPSMSEPADWWYLQIAVANVQRQAGDFAGATARLDSLTGELPAEGRPAERIALTRTLIAAGDRSAAALPDARGA